MATERVLSNLNLISFKTEGGLQNHIDELQDGDLVFTPDNSLKGVLFDFKWADHLLNDMSWLRADTFSWQSGDVYVAAYNHLVADFEGTTAETETIGGIEITYYRAEDKHKICLPDQENKILELYNKTGVAWYYILDTENKQFKLPRSKHNKYAGIVPVVGNGMALGVTTGSLDRALGSATVHDSATVNALMVSNTDPEGIKVGDGVSVPNKDNSLGTGKAYGVSTTPEKSGLIAQQTQDTDQYKYLYFYVGCFEKEGLEQTAGITAEIFNGKADSDLSNINASQSAKDTISGWMVPDYNAGIAISANTDFICPTHGVIAGEVSAASGGYCNIKVNEIVIMQVGSESNQRCRGPFYAQVQKGDVVYLLASGNANIPQSNFYPLKGVN